MDNTKTVLRPNIRPHLTDGFKLIMTAVFMSFVILPLMRMLLYIDREKIMQVINSASFLTILFNSFTVAAASTVITLIIAYALSLCISRTAIKFKGLFNVILVLPMLIPSISHGMGLKLLLGNNGIITQLFKLNTNIYGFTGIVIGSVMYAFPVAFLMLNDILKYEDYSPYEAAKILGIPKWRQFTAITFPYLRKPLISVVFATFTMIVTDYGVPLIVGGKFKTLPVVMYQEVIGQLNFGKGAVYGAILLLPALVAFLFDLFNRDRGNMSYVVKEFEQAKSTAAKAISYLCCTLLSLFVLIPIASFAYIGFVKKYPSDLTFSLSNIAKSLDMGVGGYLINSIEIAAIVALMGITISFITAYFTARMKSRMSRFLHLMAITAAAIPGLVLGLSYVVVFKGSFIYGTMAILVAVNLVHFIASPYMMMYNSLSKINENLESVGATLGISRLRMIKDVFIPQSRATLIEMAAYFFVNCMMTISAVSFLSTTATKPAALMINQFEAQMQIECAAVVSIAILLVNVSIKAILAIIKKYISKKART